MRRFRAGKFEKLNARGGFHTGSKWKNRAGKLKDLGSMKLDEAFLRPRAPGWGY